MSKIEGKKESSIDETNPKLSTILTGICGIIVGLIVGLIYKFVSGINLDAKGIIFTAFFAGFIFSKPKFKEAAKGLAMGLGGGIGLTLFYLFVYYFRN